MLQDGEKGVILQRDRQSYAVAPHLPCGIVTPEMLRTIADVAEKFHAKALKCTSAGRIAIIGLKEEDIDPVWDALGTKAGRMCGNLVRSIRACPGTEFCKRGRQDSLAMGMELDRRYYGRDLPGKFKIGVSGCGNQCSESSVKDVGLVGGPRGWTVMAGGMAGSMTRIADALVDDLNNEQALELVDRLITFFEKNARSGERLGEIIDRMGLKAFRATLGLPEDN